MKSKKQYVAGYQNTGIECFQNRICGFHQDKSEIISQRRGKQSLHKKTICC